MPSVALAAEGLFYARLRSTVEDANSNLLSVAERNKILLPFLLPKFPLL